MSIEPPIETAFPDASFTEPVDVVAPVAIVRESTVPEPVRMTCAQCGSADMVFGVDTVGEEPTAVDIVCNACGAWERM